MNTSQLLQRLLKLQALDFGEIKEKEMEKLIAKLRSQIPPPILDHYDRLHAGGKKGAVAIRNQVCTGCHLQVPRATVITLMRGDDIQLCGNCGRYLLPGRTRGTGSAASHTGAKNRRQIAQAQGSGSCRLMWQPVRPSAGRWPISPAVT